MQVIHDQNVQLWPQQAGKLNRKCMWLAQLCSLYRKSVSLNGYFASKPIKNQQIHHKMAQGSFASRIFHKYCKNSQEHREPDRVVPHISEFTTMWDKLSKCSVLSLHINMSSILCSCGQKSSAAFTFTGQNMNMLLFESIFDCIFTYRF